jgi:hypothetical protein
MCVSVCASNKYVIISRIMSEICDAFFDILATQRSPIEFPALQLDIKAKRSYIKANRFYVRAKLTKANRSSKPTGLTSKSIGFTSKPTGLTSKPRGFTSKPRGLTSKPTGFMSKPTDLASKAVPTDELSAMQGTCNRLAEAVKRPHNASFLLTFNNQKS